MKRKIILWWIRVTDKILTIEQAKHLRLTHYENIYGDIINYLNCRSRWVDENGNKYRVHDLVK